SFFREWNYMPHNSMLGLWCFTGWIGFSMLWTGLIVGILYAARGYNFGRPEQRVVALTALSFIAIYLVQCWGDLGFSERHSIFLIGPALGAAGQIALASGSSAVGTLRRGLPR